MQQRGFSLVESLITIFVISLYAATILGAMALNLKTTRLTNDRMLGATVAQAQMEKLRNLTYDELSTQNGPIIPQGNIADQETVSVEGKNYVVKTYISYYDDPFDGCYEEVTATTSRCADGTVVDKPRDVYPYDYKKITVKVYREGSDVLMAELSTNIASNAAETPSNTGILAISVSDAEGNSVSEATINVTEITSTQNPKPSFETLSTQDNFTLFPLLPPADIAYRITVSKDGYNSDYTVAPSTENPNPAKPDATIIAQEVTQVFFSIDRLATLTISSKDLQGAAIPNHSLEVKSSKTIDISGEIPKYEYNVSTNQLGEAVLENLEWGKYIISSTAGLYVISATPYQPIALMPSENIAIILYMDANASLMRLQSISPVEASNDQAVEILFIGENFALPMNIVLKKEGQSDIVGQNIAFIPDTLDMELVAEFNIVGAAVGAWDIHITKGSEVLIQREGILINAQ